MTTIRFESNTFDIENEPLNENNPVFGHAVAEWLRQKCAATGLDVTTEVANEDWGWYFYAEKDNQSYMVGTCSYVDACEKTGKPLMSETPIEHLIQFDKFRSFKEKLFGKNKLEPNDPVVSIVENIVKSQVKDVNYLGRD